MESSVLALLLVAHVVADSLTVCHCQSEGDVRLVGGANTSFHTGRLDIFWKGKWGTFCELSKKSGDAVCKQLGYSEAKVVERYSTTAEDIPIASDDMPVALGSVDCVSDLLLEVPSHVLRCEYSTDTSACTHERDIVLTCNPTSEYRNPYDTQLRIVSNTFSSTGILEININQQWGNICYSHFDQGAADSACRQLGYTNAASFSATKTQSSSIVWLSEVQCKSQSCSCLNRCFDRPNAPTSCPDSNYLFIQCTFTVSYARNMSYGQYCNIQYTGYSNLFSECTRNYTSGNDISHSGNKVPVVAIALPVVALLLCFIFTSSIISYCANKRRIGRQQHCCFDGCCHRRPRYNFIAHPDVQL